MLRPSTVFIATLLSLSSCDGSSKPSPEPTAVKAPAAVEASATPEAKAPAKKKRPKRKTKKQLDAERRTYVAELAQLDTDIASSQKLSKTYPENRLHYERLAGAFMQRARLSGSYDDYAKAEASVAKAFEYQPASGTRMLRAKLHYTLHRLPQAGEDFAAAKPTAERSPGSVASLAAFEANLAMQAGDDKTARKNFDASLAAKRTTSNLASVAVFHWKTGDFEQAEALFREALKSYHGKPMEPRAWIHLNLGLLDLDRGRYDDALVHYREAETFMKGYWLIDEHIAEILTLQGKTEEAKALYLEIIERTNNPEFMDAMAGIMFEAGKDEEGKAYVARARKRYEEQMAKYPEAAYGHALGHYIEFGEDAAYVLELAQKNYDLRPNAEAAVMLAQAHLKNDDAKAAGKALAPTLKTAFKSAELYATAAEVQAALGKDKKAQAFLEKAQAIDPTASLEDVEQTPDPERG